MLHNYSHAFFQSQSGNGNELLNSPVNSVNRCLVCCLILTLEVSPWLHWVHSFVNIHSFIFIKPFILVRFVEGVRWEMWDIYVQLWTPPCLVYLPGSVTYRRKQTQHSTSLWIWHCYFVFWISPNVSTILHAWLFSASVHSAQWIYLSSAVSCKLSTSK